MAYRLVISLYYSIDVSKLADKLQKAFSVLENAF